MNKIPFSLFSLATLLLSVTTAPAQARDFHGPPYDFLFGNHIDTHQENKLKLKRDGSPKGLSGFFYIIFESREFAGGIDDASGLRLARHPRGASHQEECGVTPGLSCVVGWTMRGLPGAAKFISHDGVNRDDHPVWLVNRAEEDSAPASGMVIPQPGSYTHFHWITSESNDPRADTVVVGSPCDANNASGIEAAGGENEVCPGWFLQIRAVKAFAFLHGGETIPVRPGIDNRSHLNLVTNYEPLTVVPITGTR